jgi:hypothetical protein
MEFEYPRATAREVELLARAHQTPSTTLCFSSVSMSGLPPTTTEWQTWGSERRAAACAEPAMATIGYLGSETPELFADRLAAFRQGLAAAGYEGRPQLPCHAIATTGSV